MSKVFFLLQLNCPTVTDEMETDVEVLKQCYKKCKADHHMHPKSQETHLMVSTLMKPIGMHATCYLPVKV